MPTSVYIHIPFCKSKCKYCSFVSYEKITKEQQKEYIKTLKKEIKTFYEGQELKTLYIGGGTPSLLDVDDIKEILNCFNTNNNTEITMEINPETVNFEKLSGFKNAGINRISIGIQSFNDKILKYIGRIHNADKAKQTVNNAIRAGFKNISADFIYGLPHQSIQDFENDLKTAINLNVNHISLYGLKIDEGCTFYNKIGELEKILPDDDMQADMYLAAINLLEKEGFKHYEISNFAKENNESQHNLNYWNEGEYYGFGVAAHGFVHNVRYANLNTIEKYKSNYTQKLERHTLTKEEKLQETIFLGFRKGDGIDVESINKEFKIDFDNKYKKIIERYSQTGYILKTQSGYRFSNEGFLVSNIILAEFV